MQECDGALSYHNDNDYNIIDIDHENDVVIWLK